jgi:enamine deaminase RidA (YjgF/YER057c/UK114 family)
MSTPTHTRIRMFNTKETYPNQSLDNDLCQAVRAGNTVYVRGQVGTDFEGNLVGLGDPAAQADQAMKNVKQLLEEAGSDLSHIVKTTVRWANGSRGYSLSPPAWWCLVWRSPSG